MQIRPICPRDADLYPAFANRISVDDRRRRFLYAGPKQLTPALLAQFTQIDRKREMAFVAIDEKSNDLLGVARMFNDPEGGGAEFAVVVRSDLQGKGLGAGFDAAAHPTCSLAKVHSTAWFGVSRQHGNAAHVSKAWFHK